MAQSHSMDNTETRDDTGEQILKSSLTLMLVGNTGHGKSSLGNCILGSEIFKVSSHMSSQTVEVVCGCTDFESCLLKVVDAPGFLDTKLSQLEDRETAERNMSIALEMCSEGIDAFLIVFRWDAFTFKGEEASVMQTLKSMFGHVCLNHAIVVLTHGDRFDTEEITFDDWCKKQRGPFRELYKACNGRFVLFNNKERDEEKQIAHREQLTQLAYDLKRRHGCYTAECFKRAASKRQRMIIRMKKQFFLKEDIRKQASILSSEILKYQDRPCVQHRTKIERAIHKLMNELQTEDKGHGLLKDLMNTVADVERNLQDVIELHSLCAKMERINKTSDIRSCLAISNYAASGILALACPPAGFSMFLVCWVSNAIGKEIISSVGKLTVTKMKVLLSNIQSRHQMLHKK